MKFKLKHCKDCEPLQQIHFFAYISIILDLFNKPFLFFMEKYFGNFADFISRSMTIPFFRVMIFLRLANLADKPDEKDTYRTKCFWEEAKKRGIKMQEFKMGPIKDIFIANYKGRKINFDDLPRPKSMESDSINWMDDKGIMNKKFKKEGIPVADGGVAFSTSSALKIFNRINKPVITKPNLGSRSRHTTIHINNEKDLITGFKKARVLSPFVIVEEELSGALFRGTLINRKLVGVVRRDQPAVFGDGIKTLRELWKEENKRPERQGPLYHLITLDKEAETELARQKISLEDIPKLGQVVTFSQKTSRGSGGTTTEVTELVHPENIKMLEHIGAFLKDPLVGVDFIMTDITKPWTEQKHCGIIECNSMPFIDLHHYPLFGKPQNIAAKLWDLVMPESKI